MRVTQGMLVRGYNKNLTRNIQNLAESNNRILTGRKFNYVSENTGASARSFSVREQIYKNEIYLDNASQAKGELATAEDNINGMNSLLKTTIERVIEGLSDTKDTVERSILGEDVDKMAEQVLKLANSRYGDKYVFGGSANGKPPFEVGDDGHLMFNGQSVGKDKPFPENIDTYTDIGLGMKTEDKLVAMGKVQPDGVTASGVSEATRGKELKVSFSQSPTAPDTIVVTMENDLGDQIATKEIPADQLDNIEIGGVSIFSKDKFQTTTGDITIPIMQKPVVDPKSAFNPRTSGIDVLGFGTNEKDGFANNIYEVMKEIASTLKTEPFDRDKLNNLLDVAKDRQNGLVISLTNVGTRDKFLDYNISRLESEASTLQKTRKSVEDVNIEEESIFSKMYESSWLITLQLGTKIIPPSIFDYMR